MGLTAIPTMASYDRATRSMSALRARAERLQGSIASGSRLARGSDDPLAAAQLRGLARSDALARAGAANAARAGADLSLADGALASIAETVIRARELAAQAGNDTLSPAQQGAIGVELGELHTRLLALANSRDSAGHALFGGEAAGAAYTGGPGGAVTYTGTASAGELALGEGTSVIRGLTGPEFLGASGADLFAALAALASDLQGGSADPAASARAALAPLDDALDAVTNAQAVTGTRLAWIDLVADHRAATSEGRATAEAAIGGTDLTTAITELQQALTVLAASQASFARLSSLSLFDLLR